jgi:two-component system KDP operon response regulator KdpE
VTPVERRTKALVVEDDPNIVDLIRSNLSVRGFDTCLSTDGSRALQLLETEQPDIVLLDLMFPDVDGFELCRQMRECSAVGIIVVSARGGQHDKVAALNFGADDYMTKPFGMDELLARIRAALRRGGTVDEEPTVVTDAFTVDLAEQRVTRDGSDVHLTPKEWDIVGVLVRNPGRLVSQRQLLHDVWGPSYETETEYLRVLMGRVRRKLEVDPSHPRHFRTEPGMGYRFEP